MCEFDHIHIHNYIYIITNSLDGVCPAQDILPPEHTVSHTY